jgi:hypothetical protein
MAPARWPSTALFTREAIRVTQARVPAAPLASEVADILDSPEVAALITDLDDLRWTGRKGYGSRALVGACLVKSLYAIPTWTRTVA